MLAAQRALTTPGWIKSDIGRKARALPSLDLRFADSKSLVDSTTGANLVTFTRASGGTYVDSQGVIRTATTNLCLQSENLGTTWTTAAVSVTANQRTAPDGTLSMDTVTATGGAGFLQQAITVTNSTVYTASVYVYAASNRTRIIIHNGTSDICNITWTSISGNTTSVSGTASSIASTHVGNSIYRLSFTFTSTSTTANYRIQPLDGSGNAVSGATGDFWGAQLEQSSTVGEYIPTGATINSAPRFDHNPTTGESLGLLLEEARTNSIRNNTMVGAVAGTPGTLPTNWSYAVGSGGLSREIVGTGAENGINYIDFRFYGTTTNTNAIAIGIDAGSAATGQTWTGSLYWKLVGGSLTGITGSTVGLIENTSGGVFVSGAFYTVNNPSGSALSLQRVSATRTLSGGATVASCLLVLNFTVTNSTAIDLTLRIGLPQLEQGAFATSVIPTTGTAATRSADVASIATLGANVRSLFSQFRSPASGTRPIVSLDDNSSNNRIELFTSGTDPKLLITSGGVAQADIDAGSVTANTTTRLAARFSTDNFAASVSGAASITDTSGTLPAADRVRIGRDQAGNYLNGTIARATAWDAALPMLAPITQ